MYRISDDRQFVRQSCLGLELKRFGKSVLLGIGRNDLQITVINDKVIGKEKAAVSQVTKRALEQSLKNLLLKKPLTKITINDIAEDCGINRMTFYYHFKDIYDLVEWSCLEDAKRALDEKKTYETWQQGFLQIFEAVQDNKPFILNVYRCVHGEQIEKYLQPLVDRLLLDVIN